MSLLDDPDASQLATSAHPFENHAVNRPAKRRRIDNVLLCGNSTPMSQSSPSKTSRKHMHSFPPRIHLFSDDADEQVEQVSLQHQQSQHPQQSPGENAIKEAEKSLKLPPSFSREPRRHEDARQHCISGEKVNDERTQHSERTCSPKVSPVDHCHKQSPGRIPEDLDIPSPPSSMSDSDGNHNNEQYKAGPSTSHMQPENSSSVPQKSQRPERVLDSSDPPECSQDSVYFSFRGQGVQFDRDGNPFTKNRAKTVPTKSLKTKNIVTLSRVDPGKSSNGTSKAVSRGDEDISLNRVEENKEVQRAPPYYMRTLNYVMEQVLERHHHLLRSQDVHVAYLMHDQISQNAYCLFARVYRRKHSCWYPVESLVKSYGEEIDVLSAVVELGRDQLFCSTNHAVESRKEMRAIVAKELVDGISGIHLKGLISCLSNSKDLKKLPLKKLVPELKSILCGRSTGRSNGKRYKQATLTGFSQSDLLAKAVLKHVGHAVKISEHVLASLRRVHFLFFLEDGHDSPNVILADTGKVKFPDYECDPQNGVFPSADAYESFESSLLLEQRLNDALQAKDFETASDLGGIAELEIREQFNPLSSLDMSSLEPSPAVPASERSETQTAQAKHMSKHNFANSEDWENIRKQLLHPFFRRYSAIWVLVRCAWHSIAALERLEEYDNASQRIELLLSTGLLSPSRRGKCLNRLTINLFRHQKQLHESLGIILTALKTDVPRLHYGDRMALAKRGLHIHRQLNMASLQQNAIKKARTKSEAKKIASHALNASRPDVLVKVIDKNSTKLKVRRIYGKSIQITTRELQQKESQKRSASWLLLMNEESRDSFATGNHSDASLMGKSKFASLGTNKQKEVAVENYCLQWYHGKEGWQGIHDEGSSLRFIFSLLFWEVIFAPVEDVFQTPFQDRPLDFYTEAFFYSRKSPIERRLVEVCGMTAMALYADVEERYTRYEPIRAVGCRWGDIQANQLSCIAAGLGGVVLSQCCRLLCEDYAYWGGGLPDLTMWKRDDGKKDFTCFTKLVEVKSARDTLSEKQRAWLIELTEKGADCEVCKVVERVTKNNVEELEEAVLDSIAVHAIDAAMLEDEE